MSSDELGKAGPPVTRDLLIQYFQTGCLQTRPGARALVGAEFEHLPVSPESGRAWPWATDGEKGGVGEAFERLSAQPAYEPGSTGEALVALKRGKAMLHLEPGGQTELASTACPDLHGVAHELESVRREIAGAAASLGFAYLSHPLQPVSAHGELGMVPKRRYKALRDYLENHGQGRAIDMMMLTASVQACFDYRDEADAGRKMRVALLAAPIASALFANSPIESGRATGHASNRAHVWLQTDRARTGMPRQLLEGAWSFERYVDFALDVPVVLVRAGETVEPGSGATFRQMMAGGVIDRRVDMGDWELHLSTLFMEARMKKFIEVRSADCPPPEAAMTVPAFWTGLLYDDGAVEAAYKLLSPLQNALSICMPQVAHAALGAAITPAVTAGNLASELCRLSHAGLKARGHGEEKYLEPALEWARTGRTASDRSLEIFRQGGVKALVDSARLRS